MRTCEPPVLPMPEDTASTATTTTNEEQKAAAAEPSAFAKGSKTNKPDNELVPDFAKKLSHSKMMKGKAKREPQIRYVYTHVPGSDAPPVKTAVIKKVTERAPPKDLISMLVEKKQNMYAKE